MNGILRPSNHLLRMAAIALIAGCAVVSSAFAAPRPDFAARFLESAHVPGVRGETVLFGPLQQMRLRVTFFNDADADQSLLLKGAYFQHIAWRWVSADGRAVDLHASWSNDAECHGPGLPMSCGLTEDRIFAPSVSVEGTVTLTLTDAAYDFGEFTLVVDLGPAAAYLQDVDHRPWNGKMISPRRFPIVIRSPANLYEQGLQHRLRGDQEAASGNHQAALTWFRQWAAAVPGDPAAVNAVGETLFLLKRFPEALNELRRADALTSNGDSLVPHNVAAALFALGRGSEAEAYLKQRYPKSPGPRQTSAVTRGPTSSRLLCNGGIPGCSAGSRVAVFKRTKTRPASSGDRPNNHQETPKGTEPAALVTLDDGAPKSASRA